MTETAKLTPILQAVQVMLGFAHSNRSNLLC